MRSKKQTLTPFSRSIQSQAFCYRPETQEQLKQILALHPHRALLPRGAGLSYSDSSLNTNRHIIDTKRLNHFIHFDEKTGIVVCQPAVTIKELFELHPDFIPPVFPGTAYATVGGAIAHDVHGKNNRHEGSFGHHVVWLELLIQNQPIFCSRDVHNQLFYATIAGLGLTGLISRVAIRLKKASDCVQVNKIHFQSLEELLPYMKIKGIDADYQMAWIDLLHPSKRNILSLAQHVPSQNLPNPYPYRLPKLPFCLLRRHNMSWINQWVFKSTTPEALVTLTQYNNPLDQIKNWNGLYGPRGFIQFQAVFDMDDGLHILNQLLELIQFYKATPILCVLKLFTQEGEGLLSFCRPGFTLAIDFYNNQEARQAILALNQYIVTVGGRIYLAKDLLLLPEQMQSIYGKLELFQAILTTYHSNMTSNLARRLRIVL